MNNGNELYRLLAEVRRGYGCIQVVKTDIANAGNVIDVLFSFGDKRMEMRLTKWHIMSEAEKISHVHRVIADELRGRHAVIVKDNAGQFVTVDFSTWWSRYLDLRQRNNLIRAAIRSETSYVLSRWEDISKPWYQPDFAAAGTLEKVAYYYIHSKRFKVGGWWADVVHYANDVLWQLPLNLYPQTVNFAQYMREAIRDHKRGGDSRFRLIWMKERKKDNSLIVDRV